MFKSARIAVNAKIRISKKFPRMGLINRDNASADVIDVNEVNHQFSYILFTYLRQNNPKPTANKLN